MNRYSNHIGFPAVPTADAVRAQVQKILASRHFQGSALLSQFLNHVVRYSLEGEEDRLKEYQLGLEVFGRNSSYDPRIDPIVRQTARRLRTKLHSYYEAEGRFDAVRIDIPKGSYSAIFSVQSPDKSVAEDGATEQPLLPTVSPGFLLTQLLLLGSPSSCE